MDKEEIDNFRKAGAISKQVVDYARGLAKPGMKLLELAERIEDKIIELGGKPAFPVNLSINDVAAHYTPSYDDENIAQGLLKVDIGVHIEGCVADTAFSVDFEDSGENRKLIEASQDALSKALEKIGKGFILADVGKIIQEAIVKHGFSPIINLSGHEIIPYIIHAGLTIPNVNNGNNFALEEGVYAIEPFATTGAGSVYEGRASGIYALENKKPMRDSIARQILKYIEEEYSTLPFCSRWIVKKFGTRGLIALQQMQSQGVLHQYPQLVEKNHGKVSQAEKTVIISNDGVEVIN